MRGAVATPLALLPCAVLQSAIKFINMTVPSSAGRIGINIRFLQRMGAPTGEAVAAGAVDDLSDTIVEIGLVLLTLPFVHIAIDRSQLKFDVPLGPPDHDRARRPRAHSRRRPRRSGGSRKGPAPAARCSPGFWAVARDRHKRLQLFGGSIATECLYALTLGTCLPCLRGQPHLPPNSCSSTPRRPRSRV